MLGIDFKQYKWFNHVWVKKTASETEHEVLRTYKSFMNHLLNDHKASVETRLSLMTEIDLEHENIMKKLSPLVINEERQRVGLPPLEERNDNIEKATTNANW